MLIPPRRTALVLLSLVSLLGACGGGGGDSTPATPSVIKPVPDTVATPAVPVTTPVAVGDTPPVITPVTTPVTTPVSPSAAGTPWKPALTDTWQWQLTGTLNTAYDVKVYDIDLYDTPAATILALQNSGKKVLCYFSAGSSENWRADFASFAAADMGNALDGWAGERWLDTRSGNVRTIMQARLDLAKSKGCDGVEPDNVDGYGNSTGFVLSAATQLDYNRFLASAAHSRGLAVALKNDVAQVADLVGHFDMAINEQCHQYGECAGYAVFTSAGKPVFNAEYAAIYKSEGTDRDSLCAESKRLGLKTLVLSVELNDSDRFSCDE